MTCSHRVLCRRHWSVSHAPAVGAAADPAAAVDLEECIRLALAHDAGLRSDELESAAANARLREMQGQYVPSVSLQGGYSRLSDVARHDRTLGLRSLFPNLPWTTARS